VKLGDMDEKPPEDACINCRLVNWTDIQEWSEKVAEKVRASGYVPDIIVGITRGGWVPARILCDVMGIKNLYSLKTEHWGVTAAPDGEAKLVAKPEIDLSGKKVLLVDDITDTGASLQLALDWVNGQGPADAKIATLLHINHSKLEPEFYTVEIAGDEWAWFIFPWNLHEDIRTLLPKTLYKERDVTSISGAFRAQFNIVVERETLEAALKQLEDSGAVKAGDGVYTV
jgi:hypoxanthine phosphoribosyltransferase